MVVTKELVLVGVVGLLVGTGIGSSMQARVATDLRHSAAQEFRDNEANSARQEQQKKIREIEVKDSEQKSDTLTDHCDKYSGSRRSLCVFRAYGWGR